MSTSTVLARVELRRGWRALLPTAVLVAVLTAVVLWSFAAARRTDTAFDRMLVDTEAQHVLVNPAAGSATEVTTDALLAFDGVADASRIEALVAFPPDADDFESMFDFVVWATDGGTGDRFARPIMVAGRWPDPAATDEIYVETSVSEALGVDVGDRIEMRLVSATEGATLWQFAELAEAGDITWADAEARMSEAMSSGGMAPVRAFTVTGVGRSPDGVVVDGGFELPSAYVSPALFDELGQPQLMYGGWPVRLDDPSSVDEFRRALDATFADETIIYQSMDNVESKVERATDTPADLLRIFAAAVLVLGILLVAQSVQRWLAGRSHVSSVLHALGSTRGERWRATVVQVTATVVVGTVVGAAIAVAASPLSPIGVARRIETRLGLHVDWLVIGGGATTVAALIVVGSMYPAWAAAGRAGSRRPARRPHSIARTLDGGVPWPVSTGVHFALDPTETGQRASRLAIVGALTGVTLATASIVLTASIAHVTSTPRLYGTNFGATLGFDGESFPDGDPNAAIDRAVETVAADPAVRVAGSIHAGEVVVAGTTLPAVAFGVPDGSINATMVAGRFPAAADEIALGTGTLERLGLDIGDEIAFGHGSGSTSATIVGRAVLPGVGTYSGSDKTSLGDGALVHPTVFDPLDSFLAVAFEWAGDPDADGLESRLTEPLATYGRPEVDELVAPSEVTSLEAIETIPRWLAIALAVLVGIPVVHSLLTSVRSRRHDLAVMSALGARPASLRWVGMFQGLTVVVGATVIGAPVGVALGRWSWSGMAESFGTIPEPVVPVGAVIALTGTVLLVGAVVGGAPVWRTDRGAILRSLRPE